MNPPVPNDIDCARPARRSWKLLAASLLVVFLTGLVFFPTVSFDYVNIDDPAYVSKNDEVQAGLTARGLADALHQRDLRLYSPLTRISHMLDCQLWGADPAGHHLTNILLHTLAALLLLLMLVKATGDLWTSALCALFFSVHPLRSESVAWISERKDVLSIACGMGALLAYACYARDAAHKLRNYLLCAGLAFLSLMAKPMLLTLPAILLVMDFWPLQRLSLATLKARLAEKLPLLAIGVGSLLLIFSIPPSPEVNIPAPNPFLWRLANACRNPVIYLQQTFWPKSLGAYYPFPEACPSWAQAVACLCGIVALTLLAFRLRKSMPYVTAGWCWFLVGLIPVVGIVPLGTERHADRYTYFPGIGLALAACWSVRMLAEKMKPAHGPRRWSTVAIPAGCSLAILALSLLTQGQNTIWQNSETLWKSTIARCGDSELAEVNLASYLESKGRAGEGLRASLAAVEIGPGVPLARLNLGNCLMDLHQVPEAIRQYRETISLNPRNSEGHANLGAAYLSLGRKKEGIAEIEIGLQLDPTQKKARANLARALGMPPPPQS